MTLKTVRKVYARNGCYENFEAYGLIPAGAIVRLMPVDRQFEEGTTRECVFVSYQGETKVISGYIYLMDLVTP